MTNTDEKLQSLLKNEYNIISSLYDGIYTKTTQFMLPSINIDIKNRVIFKYFINSFLDDKGHTHSYTRPIFILFGVPDFKDKDWNRAYTILALNKNFIFDYDCGIKDGNNLVMMVFGVPSEFENDYYNFKRGRYSKFSSEYKKHFPKYLDKEESKSSVIWKILNVCPSLKRSLEVEYNMPPGEMDRPTIQNGIKYPPAEELWDMPRKKQEYYRYYEKNISLSG